MTYRNIVVINGKEVNIETLPKEEKERLAREWNRAAARKLNYIEDKCTGYCYCNFHGNRSIWSKSRA